MMDVKFSTEQSVVLMKARIDRRRSLHPEVARSARIQAFAAPAPTSPTKDLDAVILASTLVGYGDKITLENMAIIENLIKFAKLEANDLAPQNDPEEWFHQFLRCMDEVGCLVADSGYTVYEKSSLSLTMDNVIVDIAKTAVDAAIASQPAAAAFSAITGSALDALKKEPEPLNIFHREVTKDKGVRLAIMPCDQLANGMIITSLSSIDSIGEDDQGAPLFFDWKTSSRSIFRGNAFITFNPLRYQKIKTDIEEILSDYFETALTKRFARRKKK